jgi:hypothetical protein
MAGWRQDGGGIPILNNDEGKDTIVRRIVNTPQEPSLCMVSTIIILLIQLTTIHAILKRFVMQMPTVLDVFSSFCPSLSLKEMKLFLISRKQMSSCVR